MMEKYGDINEEHTPSLKEQNEKLATEHKVCCANSVCKKELEDNSLQKQASEVIEDQLVK